MATHDELLEELSRFPAIPSGSARAYRENLEVLVDKVNKNLMSGGDLNRLIGLNTRELMGENQRYFAMLMGTVFAFNFHSLLVCYLPHMYRFFDNRAFSQAYFAAQLQAWQQVLNEFFPSEIHAPLLGVYEWMQSRLESLLKLSREHSPLGLEPAQRWKETYKGFLRALLLGNLQLGLQLARQSVSSPRQLCDFYKGVVQPAMYTIGDMWEKGQINIADEHLASALVRNIISMQFMEHLPAISPNGGKVVITAGVNEHHEIGATLVANSLEADGWKVYYLGANTPEEDLFIFISVIRPDILAISSTVPFNLEFIHRLVERIREWPMEERPKILLGGYFFQLCPQVVQAFQADGYAADCCQAVQLAAQWKA